MLSLGHMPRMKSPTFHNLGTPQQLWRRGATPPHTLSSLQCCCRGLPAPNPDTSSKSDCPRAPHLLPVGGWMGTTTGLSLCKSPPQVPTPIWHPNSSAGWSTTPSSQGLKTRQAHGLLAFLPRGVREAQYPSADLHGRPARAAICRLSYHFHFPPPLKQPPSSLALKASQPKLLHTPSYSPDLPSPAQTEPRKWETDSHRCLPGKTRPGLLPRRGQWRLSPAPWGSRPSPHSLVHRCGGGGPWGRPECRRGLNGEGAARFEE